jgi:hypothetical protein
MEHGDLKVAVFHIWGQSHNALAKGALYLPSGLYESRMIHPSPQGRVYGVS